jgi:hypothetical protein
MEIDNGIHGNMIAAQERSKVHLLWLAADIADLESEDLTSATKRITRVKKHLEVIDANLDEVRWGLRNQRPPEDEDDDSSDGAGA